MDAVVLLIALVGCMSPPEGGHGEAADVPTTWEGVASIVALGDVGKGNADQRRVADAVARVCADRGCDLIVLLGDNLYPRGMDAPDDPRIDEVITEVYRPLDLPTFTVLGNHDWGHGRDAQRAMWQVAWADARAFVRSRGRYYSGRVGPADLFALDTTPLFWGTDTPQVAWLDAALARSTARWKVVWGHHPYRSDGPHGNAGDYEGLGCVPIVDGAAFARVFEESVCGRADLYVSGHDHLLQWISACGTELVVSGSGASTRERIDRGNQPRYAESTLGFAWIELGDAMTIAFYDADATLRFEGVAGGRGHPGPQP